MGADARKEGESALAQMAGEIIFAMTVSHTGELVKG